MPFCRKNNSVSGWFIKAQYPCELPLLEAWFLLNEGDNLPNKYRLLPTYKEIKR